MFVALFFSAALPACEGKVLDAFDSRAIQAPARGSGRYVALDEQTLTAVGDALASLFGQEKKKPPDFVFALERAALAGYELCADETWVLMRPVKAGFGQPVLAIRRAEARPVIVEVPHTVFDYHTLEEGVAVFTALKARALLVSGSHRCASVKTSLCDGASAACGAANGPFRASDMAHATDTVFHRAHRAISAAFPTDSVLSLHGMDGQGAVLSDGTMIATSSTAFVARLAAELQLELGKERVRSCNGAASGAPAGEDTMKLSVRADDLCGTTNVQGRDLNGAEDACHEKATRSSGRFLHIEQSARVRKHPDTLIRALDRVLPLAPTSEDQGHLENLESLR